VGRAHLSIVSDRQAHQEPAEKTPEDGQHAVLTFFEMKRLFIFAVLVAVVIVLTARYFELLSGPVVLGGHVLA
jgi:hypothetical protein